MFPDDFAVEMRELYLLTPLVSALSRFTLSHQLSAFFNPILQDNQCSYA